MIKEEQAIEIGPEWLAKWQDIVDLLCTLAQVPVALIMRLEADEIAVLVASKEGGHPYRRGDKESLWGSGLYCERVLSTRAPLQVNDALADPAWEKNPDVRFGMIAYLGFPLLFADGRPFGTLCVLDRKATAFSPVVAELMEKLAELIGSHLELLEANHRLGERNERISAYLEELQALRGVVPICSGCKALRNGAGVWQPLEQLLIRHPEAEFSHTLCPTCMVKFYPDDAG